MLEGKRMDYPKVFDKESRPKGVSYPNPFRVLLAIILTGPFGAHVLHYKHTYLSFGEPVTESLFTGWFSFVFYCIGSVGITILFVWYVLYLQLRLYSAVQYLIGGVILGVVVASMSTASSTDTLIKFGATIAINSWMFYLFAFWGINQEQEESNIEPEIDNYYLLKAEEAFSEENYQQAIDNFEAAVSQVALGERHMVMYQQAQRHVREG